MQNNIMANKEEIYGAFVDYYGDITLDKLKVEDNWTIYCTKMNSGLNSYRYIYVVVSNIMAPGQQATLNQLDWISFQTRETEELYKVSTTNFYLDDTKKKVLSDMITVNERTKTETIYYTDDLPIRIRLLHDPKKNNHLQYPDRAFLYQALNTYHCVVELL